MCDELSSVNGPMKVHCFHHWWNECGTSYPVLGCCHKGKKKMYDTEFIGPHPKRCKVFVGNMILKAFWVTPKTCKAFVGDDFEAFFWVLPNENM